MNSKNKINATEGNVFYKLLQFSIPLIFSSLFQLLFNAADLAVIGKFAGDVAQAAVGSTVSLINLLIHLFIGLSVGTNVVIAKYFGANERNKISVAIHTALAISIISGVVLTLVGCFFSEKFLKIMSCPQDVMPLSKKYLQIYFCGITASMIYNFGAAILKAKGDTKRPLYILICTGFINLVLNIFFVVVLKWSVEGVAVATIVSQLISAFVIIILLMKEKDEFQFKVRNLQIDKSIALEIMRIGLPAGFQGILFSIANVLIQSSINSFGAIVMSGNSAACNLEGFVYTAIVGFSQGTLTFCSQNLGAKKYDRIKKTVLISQISIIVITSLLSFIFLVFRNKLLGLYTNNPEVVKVASQKCLVSFTTYYILGMMDSMASAIRGIGYSIAPVIIGLIGACLFRIIYIFTIFQIEKFHNPLTIFISYPISWIITYFANLICFMIIFKRIKKTNTL